MYPSRKPFVCSTSSGEKGSPPRLRSSSRSAARRAKRRFSSRTGRSQMVSSCWCRARPVCDAVAAQTGRARHQQELTIWLRPVRDENRLFALRAALRELERSLGGDPFSPEEVEQTKGFLDGYILLFDQTDARKLGYALDDQFYGMPGFLAAWRASLRRVTADQVNAAWRKWIDPSKLEIVLAGKDMAAVK